MKHSVSCWTPPSAHTHVHIQSTLHVRTSPYYTYEIPSNQNDNSVVDLLCVCVCVCAPPIRNNLIYTLLLSLSGLLKHQRSLLTSKHFSLTSGKTQQRKSPFLLRNLYVDYLT